MSLRDRITLFIAGLAGAGDFLSLSVVLLLTLSAGHG